MRKVGKRGQKHDNLPKLITFANKEVLSRMHSQTKKINDAWSDEGRGG